MTTEREQLEMAAKACGITGWQSKHGYWNMKDIDGKDVVCCSGWGKYDPDTGELNNPTFADAVAELNWNPPTDDGDCARMEAQLGIWVTWSEAGVTAAYVGTSNITSSEYFKDHNNDKNAARRAASVAVAAQIGRMK